MQGSSVAVSQKTDLRGRKGELMIVRHTGHLIEISAREIPNSHNWAATVLVSWDGEDQRKIHEFHGPIDGFATQKDSESWGVAFGTKWINDGKPDFTSPADF
jgi:hypothetical protein